MNEVGARRRTRAAAAALLIFLVLTGSGCSLLHGDEEPADRDRLTLSDDGFSLAEFGDSIEQASGRLRERWGPEEVREMVCESSATSRILAWDGVVLVFNDRGLAGYLFGPRADDPITPVAWDVGKASTDQGLRLGDTVARARELYGRNFVLTETSLGPEWWVETDAVGEHSVRGFATGLGPRDTIARIGAGDLCAAR
ncbi:hypothetical protein ACN26Y_21095 [Micromonospora sp. WMMD558]|uniref:hypothetical protein n=1 Tax=Micromonospora sp. WMMD558 TaxID=3403462 RepID=UPI003BF4E3FD